MSKVLKSSALRWEDTSSESIQVGVHPNAMQAMDEVAATISDAVVDERLEQQIADTMEQINQMLLSARAEAEQILTVARQEAETIRTQARQEGHDEGYRDAQSEVRVEFNKWKQEETVRLTALAESIEGQRTAQLQQLQSVIEKFAVESTRRLIHRELELAPVNIERVVSELLQYVVQGTSAQVRVHPDDFVQARSAQPKWRLAKFGEWVISVVPDGNLTPGDCEVYADTGWIDGRLNTRLEELQQALHESGKAGELDAQS